MSGMQVKKYFEKKVSLLSTSDVRYDGELYTVDPSEQSIALKHVNCMGTEGRRSGDQAIAPSDCTYEFIIFRAVNIRELWLDEGNGRRRDLTNEILNPLRAGQNVDNYPKQRSDMYDTEAPKRKVGYQSRSSQQQGYDPYYGGGYDAYYGRGGRQGGRGYGGPPPPQRTYVNDQPRGGGYGGPPAQTYYDTPSQDNYYGRGGSGGGYGYSNRGGQYGAPPPQAPPQSYNRQRQRPPQYYNQQPKPQYYNQGYGGQQYGYQQQRRYQNNRGYGGQRYNQNRSYNTGRYNNQRNNQTRSDNRPRGNNEQAGTGAFLDSRRLRGDEIDIKDAQDFDFGAAVMQKEDDTRPNGIGNPLTENIVGPIESTTDKDKDKTEATEATDDAKAEVNGDAEDETKEDISKKYDKNKSFFDALPTETKKSKPKQNLQQQKDVDTKTFGSVAATYKSRHINRQNRGYRNRGYNQGNNYRNNQGQRQAGYNQPRQGGYQNYNRQAQAQYQRQPQNVGYSTSKWVRR